MKRWSPLLSLLLLCPRSGFAETREFTNAEGRKLEAEVLDAQPGWVSVKRKDGHKFILTTDKLSEADRTWVLEWIKKREADAVAKKRAVEIPAKLTAYCKANAGKQVGNGECWTLADEAFKACELRRPDSALRVWGRKLDLTKEKPQAGDIVEFRTAKFSDGGVTGPEHTAIVTAAGKKGRITIAEQNWSGNKTVREREMDPAGLKSGEMMFYRPE